MNYEFKERLAHGGRWYLAYRISVDGIDKMFSADQVRSMLKRGIKIKGIALTRNNCIVRRDKTN